MEPDRKVSIWPKYEEELGPGLAISTAGNVHTSAVYAFDGASALGESNDTEESDSSLCSSSSQETVIITFVSVPCSCKNNPSTLYFQYFLGTAACLLFLLMHFLNWSRNETHLRLHSGPERYKNIILHLFCGVCICIF